MKTAAAVALAVVALLFFAGRELASEQPAPVLVAETAPQKEPQALGDLIVANIASEKFADVFGYLPEWQKVAGEKNGENHKWRMKEGWERFKDLAPRLTGESGLDPKNKSGIVDSEEKWNSASDAARTAVFSGLYRMYAAEQWEKRLKEGGWFMFRKTVKLDVEGQGEAKLAYRNRYNDFIDLALAREGGYWYLADIKFKMDAKLPEKPKD